MPAYTVAQLEGILGTYTKPGVTFISALSQVLPRIYAMGLWRDLAYETSCTSTYGYISLPEDTDSVLAVTVNNFPRPARSLWHDIRISGRSATIAPNYGIVDAGYFPVRLDMKDVQGVAESDVAAVTDSLLMARHKGRLTPIIESIFTGTVAIRVGLVDGGTAPMTQGASVDDELVFESFAGEFNQIASIAYTDVSAAFDLIDPNFPEQIIATIPKGSGVLRFRRFRVTTEGTVHLLVKRAAPSTRQILSRVHAVCATSPHTNHAHRCHPSGASP